MKPSLILPLGLLVFLLGVLPHVSAAQEPTIRITGLVDYPYNITLSEIQTLPQVTERATCRCVGRPPDNPGVNGYDVYTYDWTGVTVATLLDKAGVKQGAVYVVFYTSDGYSSGLQMQYAMDTNNIVATKTDSAPLDRSTGDPFRLVVPGWWGYKWVKFVERIDVVDYIYKGIWESSGYADVEIISTPSGGVDLVQYGLPLALLGVAAVAVGLYIAGRPRG